MKKTLKKLQHFWMIFKKKLCFLKYKKMYFILNTKLITLFNLVYLIKH